MGMDRMENSPRHLGPARQVTRSLNLCYQTNRITEGTNHGSWDVNVYLHHCCHSRDRDRYISALVCRRKAYVETAIPKLVDARSLYPRMDSKSQAGTSYPEQRARSSRVNMVREESRARRASWSQKCRSDYVGPHAARDARTRVAAPPLEGRL